MIIPTKKVDYPHIDTATEDCTRLIIACSVTQAKLYAVIGDYVVDGEAWYHPNKSVKIVTFKDIQLFEGHIDQSEKEAAWREVDAILKSNVLPFITPELVKTCWTIAKINGYVQARQEALRSWNALKNADPDLVEELLNDTSK